MSDWHFSVREINGELYVNSRSTDRRSADYVIEQLHRLKQFLRKPPHNPIVPEVWKRTRAFE